MKINFKNASIRIKLTIIITLVTVLALLLSSVAVLNYQKKVFLQDAINSLEVQARIIGQNNTAALAFNDTAITREILKTFENDVLIKGTCIFNAEKLPFSYYFIKKSDNNCFSNVGNFNLGSSVLGDSLIITTQIIHDEENASEIVGYIMISKSLDGLKQMEQNFLTTILIIFFVVLIISLIISTFLQRIISSPLVKLAGLTKQISKTGNYNLSLNYDSHDETGMLVSGFNEMLKKIHISSQELEEARNLAEKNAKVKEEFLANMSHEIRTPLNAITGLSNILLDTPVNEEQLKYLKSIKSASDNLLLIVNDILDYSKLNAHRVEFEKVEFSIYELVSEIEQALKIKTREKGIEFFVEIEQKLNPIVIGDKVRLYQILINLIGNAIKFTDKGYVKIMVSCDAITGSMGTYKFCIADTGIGIPNDKLNLIFESFRQASTQTTRKYGGTGLGLAISKQLVELQGGKIWVESSVGDGSKFFFTIDYPILDKQSSEVKKVTEEVIDFQKLKLARVLLVEDNHLNVMVVSTLLKKKGIAYIQIASNGAEAIYQLTNNSFNVVLMDINLPDMSGIEITHHVRSHFPNPTRDIPIIALTADTSISDYETLVSSGMNDFVPKPFKPEILYQKIIKYLP